MMLSAHVSSPEVVSLGCGTGQPLLAASACPLVEPAVGTLSFRLGSVQVRPSPFIQVSTEKAVSSFKFVGRDR